MAQKDTFLGSEGDQWFQRNTQTSLQNSDRLTKILQDIDIAPKKILMIGSGNGHELESMREAFSAECSGIDPSEEAISDGSEKFPKVKLKVGTADKLDFPDDAFDMVIFGHCLVYCDRDDLFKIALEADRVLIDGGNLLINDFHTPFGYKNKYIHCEDVSCYKMDYAAMFTWNPNYSLIYQMTYTHQGFDGREKVDERVAVSVLQKNSEEAYLEDPYSRNA